MKIAVISDIHGNMEAIDAVMADSDFQTEILDLPAGLSVSYKRN